MPSSSSPAPLGLFSPEMLANPYPAYQRLRSTAPVVWLDALKAWVITRHENVVAVLRDSRFSSVRFGKVMERESLRDKHQIAQMFESRTNSMLSCDSPRHTRLRGLVSKAFTPRAVAAMKPTIAALVGGLLDEAQARGEVDIIRDLAGPLPVAVIAAMLGIPPEDRGKFKHWSDDIAATANVMEGLSDEVLERSAVAYQELTEYFRDLIDHLRSG